MENTEKFVALEELGPQFSHAFVQRIPGVDVDGDKVEVVARLSPYHRKVAATLGFDADKIWTGEQVHGAEIAMVPIVGQETSVAGVDGFLTNVAGTLLGIHVADCCAVYLVDPVAKAIGLLHAGFRGSMAGIVGRSILIMVQKLGCKPGDIRVQLSPCIRPPHYEIDIPTQIKRDALAQGIAPAHFYDCGTCTFSDPEHYYSYRREEGKTGRLMALLGLRGSRA